VLRVPPCCEVRDGVRGDSQLPRCESPPFVRHGRRPSMEPPHWRHDVLHLSPLLSSVLFSFVWPPSSLLTATAPPPPSPSPPPTRTRTHTLTSPVLPGSSHPHTSIPTADKPAGGHRHPLFPTWTAVSVAVQYQLPSTHEVRSQCLRTPSKAVRSCSIGFGLQLVPRARTSPRSRPPAVRVRVHGGAVIREIESNWGVLVAKDTAVEQLFGFACLPAVRCAMASATTHP